MQDKYTLEIDPRHAAVDACNAAGDGLNDIATLIKKSCPPFADLHITAWPSALSSRKWQAMKTPVRWHTRGEMQQNLRQL